MCKECGCAVERHNSGKCPAEVDDRGPEPGIGIERLVGVTDCPALPAGEPFYQNVDRTGFVVFEDDSELSLLRIIPGKLSTADRAGFAPVKDQAVTCQQTALDNINKERVNAGLFHVSARSGGFRYLVSINYILFRTMLMALYLPHRVYEH
jgi:hypothetical protein